MATRDDSRTANSARWHARAENVLAGGVSSEFRKAPPGRNVVYVRGQGARIHDVDGNVYLDFALSQGPLVLGHSPAEVLDAVDAASRDGQIFAGQHPREIELAETVQRLVPCAERIRFALSGSEADHAAIRLARAATGRPLFVRFEGHYHGWLDSVAWSVGATDPEGLGPREAPVAVPWSQGLRSEDAAGCVVLPWNDLAAVERTVSARHREIAAIVTEPIMCNAGCIEPVPGFLEGLRALCDRYGIVLIFDEVITGFRVGLGGVQALCGVVPDLGVFGKAIANGYPIAVLAGKEATMRWIADGRVVHAGTMNAGNPCVAAAAATLAILERDRVPDRLTVLGTRLAEGLRRVAREAGAPLRVAGPGPMVHCAFTSAESVRDLRDTFAFDRPRYLRFVHALQDRGIRLIPRGIWYVSAAHTEADIDHAVAVAGEVLRGEAVA